MTTETTNLNLGQEDELFRMGVYLAEGASMPKRQTDRSVGYDLSANVDEVIKPGETKMVGTGVFLDLPEGLSCNMYARSSLPIKKGLVLANGVGLIDEDYVGELKFILTNITNEPVNISSGDRLGQLVFIPTALIYMGQSIDNIMHQLPEPPQPKGNRTGGFGSTGE